MDTVTGTDMAKAMLSLGATSCLHRFQSVEDNYEQLKSVLELAKTESLSALPMVSVGVGASEIDRAIALREAGAKHFIIDVAHGATMLVVNQFKQLRDTLGNDVYITVGNFATAQTILDFKHHCAGYKPPDAYKGGIGGGCFGAGTRVLMANGTYKDIEKMQLGDRVINKFGNPVTVTGVKFSGIKKVLSYRTNTFYKPTLATPDHQHWVGDLSSAPSVIRRSRAKCLDKPTKKEQSKYKWKRLDECDDALMLMPKNINFEIQDSFSINLSEFYLARRGMEGIKDINTNVAPSYDLGYIIGTYLGDGSTNIHHSMRGKRKNTTATSSWYFGKEEIEIAEKLKTALKVVFDVSAKIVPGKNILEVVVRNNFMSRFLYSFGKKENKHLPDKFLCSNNQYLQGIYDGLLDSDGHYAADGRNSLCNTSFKLHELFFFLNYKLLGYFPSVQVKPPSAGGLKNCNIENCRETYASRTLKDSSKYMTNEYQIVPFSDPTPKEILIPTYDIEVDCPSHSFIANNAIVHNSACLTRHVTGCGIPTFSTILDCKQSGEVVIADGGMRSSGDIAKALAAGADMVMLGGMLAGTKEAPGEIIHVGGASYKKYRGSASTESYKAQGKEAQHRSYEGDSFEVPYKGSVADVLQQIEGGLRSAFTYVGANDISEFRTNAEFIQVTSAGITENGAHGKK